MRRGSTTPSARPRTARRDGRRSDTFPPLVLVAILGPKRLMGADEVSVRADLEGHPLGIPAQDLSHAFRHHRCSAHSLVQRLVEETQPADQYESLDQGVRAATMVAERMGKVL